MDPLYIQSVKIEDSDSDSESELSVEFADAQLERILDYAIQHGDHDKIGRAHV